MAAERNTDGTVIAQKINMQMENVTTTKNAISLNAFGMDTIVMILNHFRLIISINVLVIIKGIGSNFHTWVERKVEMIFIKKGPSGQAKW